MRNRKKIFVLAGVLVLLLAGCGSKGAKQNREGLELMAAGKYAEAVSEFEAAIVADNKEPLYYDHMGMAYLEMEEYDAAESAFQMALNLSAEDKRARRGLGICYLRQGRFEESIGELSEAIELAGHKIGKEEYDCLLYKAEAELGMEDYGAAVSTYGILVDADAKNADYRYLRGRAYLMQGKLTEALAEFDAGIACAPKDYAYYTNIYTLLEARGYAAEGKTYLNNALAIGGKTDEVHRYRGEIQYLLGNYSSAVAEFGAIKGELDSRSCIFLGLSYTGMGDAENAYTSYMQALEQNPDDASLYEELGILKMGEGDYRMALRFFEQGLALEDASLQQELRFYEAVCYEYLQEYQTALEKFEAIRAEYGDSPEVNHEIEFLRTR